MNKIQLFKKLIFIIEQNDIPYAIVGRTEGYPQTIGSDIDIVIPRNKIKTFHHAIWFMEDKDTQIVQMLQHEIVAFYYVLFHFEKENIISIQPDVCTDYYRKGRKLLTADYLLEGKQEAKQGGFKVLAPEKEFIYYLLKKVDKRNLSKEQFTHIRNSFLENTSKALQEAHLFWNDNDIIIIQQALEENNYQLLNTNLEKLQNGIHSSHKKDLKNTCKNILLKIKRILNPTGYTIAIMGPDGSGKTTVINQLKLDIRPAFRQQQEFHFFPKPSKGTNIITDPHSKKKRNIFFSVLKLFYFIVLYNWGTIRYVLPMKIKSTLTIFDRYFDDILIDPLRYRNGTPQWIVKICSRFIPEPSLWIILDCPTNIIQTRKSEVPISETERQCQAYLAFAKTKKNCIILNTNREIEAISLEACKFISASLNERSIKRHKR